MTENERDDLRALQDKWLAIQAVQYQVNAYGEDKPISGGPGSPTFGDVRAKLYPEWRGWFMDFFV